MYFMIIDVFVFWGLNMRLFQSLLITSSIILLGFSVHAQQEKFFPFNPEEIDGLQGVYNIPFVSQKTYYSEVTDYSKSKPSKLENLFLMAGNTQTRAGNTQTSTFYKSIKLYFQPHKIIPAMQCLAEFPPDMHDMFLQAVLLKEQRTPPFSTQPFGYCYNNIFSLSETPTVIGKCETWATQSPEQLRDNLRSILYLFQIDCLKVLCRKNHDLMNQVLGSVFDANASERSLEMNLTPKTINMLAELLNYALGHVVKLTSVEGITGKSVWVMRFKYGEACVDIPAEKSYFSLTGVGIYHLLLRDRLSTFFTHPQNPIMWDSNQRLLTSRFVLRKN